MFPQNEKYEGILYFSNIVRAELLFIFARKYYVYFNYFT